MKEVVICDDRGDYDRGFKGFKRRRYRRSGIQASRREGYYSQSPVERLLVAGI
jgi:hypothetical protein